MTADSAAGVPVAFAEGVLDDVRELTAISLKDDRKHLVQAEALKQRIAELLVECKGNPFLGELMGSGLHPELANCRRVRFDIPSYSGKPRFRLIYRNEPSDGAPAKCRWLTVAPRAGLRAHRKARQRLRRD
jgi:hypothetical protein